MVDLGALVPEGHRLRQLDDALDLSFVHEAFAPFYTPGWGRPSVDPELALRMMILGVAYDLSDRRLCDEVRMHAGFRWFCRLNFHDSLPSHSTLSRLRNERWTDSDIFTRLFEEVLGHCVSSGIVSGRHVSVDGTQIRANASMKSMERDRIQGPDSSDPPPERSGSEAGEEEAAGGESPILSLVGVESPTPKEEPVVREPKPAGDWRGHGERYSNQTHTFTTDPDARLYRKGRNQGASLSFLVHDVIDTKSRVILGRRASIATSRAEREVTLELLSEHEERREGLGLKQAVEVLTGDTGYGAGDPERTWTSLVILRLTNSVWWHHRQAASYAAVGLTLCAQTHPFSTRYIS